MGRKALIFSVLVIFAITFSGCATAKKQKQAEMDIQGLRNQVSLLEAQIQSKDEEINGLKEELSRATEEKEATTNFAGKKRIISEVKSRPKIKQIQIALINAGYNPGPIDGRLGKQTREAIKAFQKANNLKADGKVGRNTWNLLKEYLDKKIK